ncbi:MAG TPA: GNAT family N-acetyltransferase [Tepidisphaeraceae bacterium]|nr:GNAT family N-acetyltransferase [Tepidisphaeraceae bacterium]
MTSVKPVGLSIATESFPIARVIRDVREWDLLEPEWEELFARSPAASAPLRFRWLREWWRVYGTAYGDRGRGLRIITVRRKDDLIGVLPLYEGVAKKGPLAWRRLEFVSTGEAEFEETCPEALDLLYAPGEQASCLDAIRGVLDSDAVRWEELDLRDVSADSPLLRWARDLEGDCRTSIEQRGACAIADISGGLEAYLARLSANSRQHSRRLLRGAQRAGAIMEVATTADEAAEYLEQLIRLHQKRWTQAGKPGCFAAPRFTEFHRALVLEGVPDGRVVLGRLAVGGKPLAVIYGFVTGRKFDFYQSGVLFDGPDSARPDPACTVASPGIVAFLLLMARLAERGVEEFDFLKADGESSYKHRLATRHRPLCRLVATRRTPKQFALHGIRLSGRAVRRSFASSNPLPAPSPLAPATAATEKRRFISRTDLAAGLLEGSGMGAALRAMGAWRGLLVLAYHRIGDGSRSCFDRELWSATPDDFDSQIKLLKRHADVIAPEDLPHVAGRRRGRHVLITFDDGYRDNFETAFPILQSHGVRSLFFVTTGFLDRRGLSWWDEIAWMVRSSRRDEIPRSEWVRERIVFDRPDCDRAIGALLAIYKTLPGDATDPYLRHLAQTTGSGRHCGIEADRTWMTWDMLREMSRSGMGVGGHTVGHPILANLPPHRQREEIAGCAGRIREEMGLAMRWLSYPSGKPLTFDAHTYACLAEQGVELAFSAYGGINRNSGWDNYDVRRTGVEMNRSPRWLKMALTLPQICV